MKEIAVSTKTLKWLTSSDTGMSSLALAACYFGLPTKGHYPSDTHDFGRCVRFLNTLSPDGKRQALSRVGELSPIWKALAENWYELEKIEDNDVLYTAIKRLGRE